MPNTPTNTFDGLATDLSEMVSVSNDSFSESISESASGTLPKALGHVTVNERVPTPRFSQFVDEQIRIWMRDHQIAEDVSEYEVAFFDEDPLGEVSCLVVVQSGEQMWRAWESADAPRTALTRSLETLHTEESDEEESQTH